MATKKPAPKPPALRKPDMAPINNVRNPNFESELAMQNYRNSMEDQQARLSAERGNFTQGRLMGAPIGQGGLGSPGGLGRLTADQAGISPEQKKILDDLMAGQTSGGGVGGMTANQAGVPVDQKKILDNLMATQQGGNMAGMPIANQPIRPNPAMGQIANYNQMLQQGMQRNKDMNQAGQNLAAPAGPARSFSQVAGGINRMNRAPRQPQNNSLAPTNQKLI